MQIIPEPIVFQWDHGNLHKNVEQHHVTNQECEEVFFDSVKRIFARHPTFRE